MATVTRKPAGPKKPVGPKKPPRAVKVIPYPTMSCEAPTLPKRAAKLAAARPAKIVIPYPTALCEDEKLLNRVIDALKPIPYPYCDPPDTVVRATAKRKTAKGKRG